MSSTSKHPKCPDLSALLDLEESHPLSVDSPIIHEASGTKLQLHSSIVRAYGLELSDFFFLRSSTLSVHSILPFLRLLCRGFPALKPSDSWSRGHLKHKCDCIYLSLKCGLSYVPAAFPKALSDYVLLGHQLSYPSLYPKPTTEEPSSSPSPSKKQIQEDLLAAFLHLWSSCERNVTALNAFVQSLRVFPTFFVENAQVLRATADEDFAFFLELVQLHSSSRDVVSTRPTFCRTQTANSPQPPSQQPGSSRDPQSLRSSSSISSFLHSQTSPRTIPSSPSTLLTYLMQQGEDYQTLRPMPIEEHLAPSEFFYFVLPKLNLYAKVTGWVLFPQWHYFRRLLESGLDEAQSRVITLPNDFPKRVLRNIIRLCYAMRPKPLKRQENALFIMENGAEYELVDNLTKIPLSPFQPLIRLAIEVLDEPLTESNCINQLVLHSKTGNKQEMEPILRYIAKRWHRISTSQEPSIATLSSELLESIAKLADPNDTKKKAKKSGTESESDGVA